MDNPNRGREQFADPNSPFDAIDQELVTYPSRESFSTAIDGYESDYFDTNFGMSVLRYTDMIAEANTKLWMNDPVPSSANAAFYRGAMLGLHATLRYIPANLCQSALGANFGINLEPTDGESREDFNTRSCMITLDHLDVIAKQIQNLPPMAKSALEDASERAYGNSDSLHRNRFESGALYAMWAALNAPAASDT